MLPQSNAWGPRMNARIVTDDLLRAAIGLRKDAGVSSAKIESLIASFVSGEPQGEDGTTRIDPQDVPPARREEFMGALAALAPEPDYSPENSGRIMTASDVWPLRIVEDAMMHRRGFETPSNPEAVPEPTDGVPPSTPGGEIPQEALSEQPQTAEVVEYAVASDAGSFSPPVSPAVPPAAADISQDAADHGQNLAEPVEFVPASDPVSPTINPETDSTEGVSVMWDKGDLERMKTDIGARRDAMLERHAKALKELILGHADELRQLDADHKEIEALEEAIDTLSRKIKPVSPDPAVASLEDERALRQGPA